MISTRKLAKAKKVLAALEEESKSWHYAHHFEIDELIAIIKSLIN